VGLKSGELRGGTTATDLFRGLQHGTHGRLKTFSRQAAYEAWESFSGDDRRLDLNSWRHDGVSIVKKINKIDSTFKAIPDKKNRSLDSVHRGSRFRSYSSPLFAHKGGVANDGMKAE